MKNGIEQRTYFKTYIHGKDQENEPEYEPDKEGGGREREENYKEENKCIGHINTV